MFTPTPPTSTRLGRQLALAVALLFLSLTGLGARPNIDCSNESCVLTISPGLAFEASYANTLEFDDGMSYSLGGDVLIHTSTTTIRLAEAELVFTASDEAPHVELFGYARAPLGEIPLLGEASLGVEPIVAMGLIGRERLQAFAEEPLPLAVVDGREPSYLFFHFDTGLELDLGLAELLGLNTEEGASDPFQYEFPGDTSLTMVLDPADPYFFLSSDARKLAMEKIEKGAQRARLAYEVVKAEREEEKRRAQEQESGEDGKKKKKKKGKKDKGADTKKSKKGKSSKKSKRSKKKKKKKSGGMSLGSVAYSWNGGIPFEPETVWGLPEGVGAFGGNVFVETTIPLGYGVSVSGPVVAYLGREGVEIGANGTVAIGAGLVGDILGVSMELGQASAGQAIRDGRFMHYFSGILDPDTSFLPRSVPVVPSVELRVASFIDSSRLEDTRILARGSFDLGADALGKLIGVKLSKALEIDGEIAVDAGGVWISGTTTSRIHKDLAFSGEIAVEAYFSPRNLEESYISMSGDLTIAGVSVGGAELDLSASGFFVNGHFYTPVSEIELGGEISRSGVILEGRSSVNFGLDGVSDAIFDAEREVAKAQAEVTRLDRVIASARDTVKSERASDTAKLEAARARVRSAEGSVNSINDSISSKYSRISKLKAEIKSWKSWYNKQPVLKKATAWTKYLAEKGKRDVEIARRYTEIGGLKTALATAKLTLKGTQEALKLVEKVVDMTPIDLDPRVAAPLTARVAALDVLEAAERLLAALPRPRGDFVGEISVSLSRRGIDGDLAVTIDGRPVVGGTVDFDGSPKACVSVGGLGEVCAGF